jgi:hypothetical protein
MLYIFVRNLVTLALAGLAVYLMATAIEHRAHAATIVGPYSTQSAPEEMATFATDRVKRVAISLPVPNVKAGDVIVVHAKAQVTNNSDQWADLGRSMILAAAPDDTKGMDTTEQNDENLGPGSCFLDFLFHCTVVHHLIVQETGIFVVPADRPVVYANLLVWATTDPPANNALTLDRGYGEIHAVVLRPE